MEPKANENHSHQEGKSMNMVCRVSGLHWALPGFAGITVAAIHPLIALPLPALHKLARKHCQPADEQMLFVAYLFQSSMVQFSAPLAPSTLHESLVAEWLPELPRIVAEVQRDKRGLPVFHWSTETDTTALANWLEAIDEALTDELRANRAGAYREQRAIRRVTAMRAKSAAVHFESVLQWAAQYLFARCPEFAACEKRKEETQEQFLKRESQTLRKATAELKAACSVGAANSTPLALLQMQRVRCVEFLPVNDDTQRAKVSLLLARLDAAILRKIDFLQSIGAQSPDESAELLAEIGTNYTIESTAGTFINSARDGAEALVSIQQRTAAGTLETMLAVLEAATAGAENTPEPKRADFATQLAFQIAYTKWRIARAKP
jgi:hypothetical protein